ncbi:citrate transporter [Sediminitomix flava]|uniref:Citrate transporter n=1 Tax=Sediminitomix flava TaxID=379075 RepID=A0A316A295_SEDFL|nr:citrate transporter [Sediminitomix flava]PWJ43817.1 hypothetical protein BC781_101163 [Sediminitomix flava]
MEVIQVTALLGVFLVMSFLMFKRVLPALIALPVMAILIALIGGVTLDDTIKYVIGMGATKLGEAIVVAIFGGMLSILLQKTKVAETFIKKGAELSGDNPWVISVIMMLLIVLLFTTLGGLGAIIMVATIVLPILSSVGVGAMTSVGIFLIGVSIGGALNVTNWAVYINVMGLTIDDVRPFALVMFTMGLLIGIIYITLQLYRDGHNLNIKNIVIRCVVGALVILGIKYGYDNFATEAVRENVDAVTTYIGLALKYTTAIGVIGLFTAAAIRIVTGKNEKIKEPHWISVFSPIIPLLLILVFNMDFIASFVVGLIYTFLSTFKKGALNQFIQASFEGASVVMPAVILMFGIGMLLIAIIGPGIELEQYKAGWPVINLLKPLIAQIIPSSPWAYVVIFTIAAPLALYRGPLNIWGMGYGLAAILMASGMSGGAVMGVLMATGQVQGISDPTNIQNVWLANEMKVDVQKVLWNTLAYAWVLSFFGLIVAAGMFY